MRLKMGDSPMIVLHGLKACDTCRKALKLLSLQGHDVRLRDLRDDPVTRAEVADWHDALGDTMLNTRSMTWRGLPEEVRAGDFVTLMVAHPALIKRPVVDTDTTLHLGWTQATRAALGLTD